MLEFDGVGFAYAAQDWVFRNVSFTVAAGSATAILGPNGSGKTTLVRVAAGLVTPQEGRVLRGDQVGYVPQAHGSGFAYRAVDMVLMGRARQVRLFRTPSAGDRTAAVLAMDRVGVAGLRDRLFPTLSGGEQQLVLIARAIAAESSVLVLDEPSTALDLKNQVRVLTLLRELVADGMAMLVSTHHPDHALYLADAVILMNSTGVRCGAAGELLTDASLSELYGVTVSAVDYTDQVRGTRRRTIVTHYDDPPTLRRGDPG